MPSASSWAQQSLKMLRCNKRSRHSRKPSSALQDAPARQSYPRPAPCPSPPLAPHLGAPHLCRLCSRPISTKTYPPRLRALPPRHSGAAAALSAASHPCMPSRSPTYSRVQRSSLPPYRRILTRLSMPTMRSTASALRPSGRLESLHRLTRLRTRIHSP